MGKCGKMTSRERVLMFQLEWGKNKRKSQKKIHIKVRVAGSTIWREGDGKQRVQDPPATEERKGGWGKSLDKRCIRE